MPRGIDKYMLGAALALLLLGFMMILSASPASAARISADGFYFSKRQLAYLLLGAAVCWGAVRLDYRRLGYLAAPGLLLSLLLLGLTYIPVFRLNAGGAARWLSLGFFSFQPAELAKIFIVIYIARALAGKKNIRNFWRGIFPLLLVSGTVITAILCQPDLGTSLVIAATVFLLLIAAGSNLADLFLLALLGLRALAFLVPRTPYQLERWTTFLNPEQDPLGAGYNIRQSLIAVGSGGFWGLGLGHSRQKFAYLPENFTDFIFAVICEEGGFLWGALIICAFAVLVLRGLRLTARADTPFGGFLALGFSLCLGIQALAHMLVVTGWAPTKGLTLPFVSYGGTSLIVSLFMLGVLLNISRHARE